MNWLRRKSNSDLFQLIHRRYLPIIVSLIIVYSLNLLYKGRTGSGDRLVGPSLDALYYSNMTLFADHREDIRILIPSLYANRFLVPVLLNNFLPEDKMLYKDGQSQLTWFGVSKDPFQNPIPELDLVVANKIGLYLYLVWTNTKMFGVQSLRVTKKKLIPLTTIFYICRHYS